MSEPAPPPGCIPWGCLGVGLVAWIFAAVLLWLGPEAFGRLCPVAMFAAILINTWREQRFRLTLGLEVRRDTRPVAYWSIMAFAAALMLVATILFAMKALEPALPGG